MMQKHYFIVAATCLLVIISGTYLKTAGQSSDKKGVPELDWPIEVLSDGHGFSEFWIEGFHRDSKASRQIFQNRVYALNLRSLKLYFYSRQENTLHHSR